MTDSATDGALKFRGVVLPEGVARDVYVVNGRVTYEPVASAELVAEGWIVPGLVDAHCHIGLDPKGAVPDEVSEEQALTDRDAGALLLRDCGSPSDTTWGGRTGRGLHLRLRPASERAGTGILRERIRRRSQHRC